MTQRKFTSDPKFIESQINLAKARMKQLKNSNFLKESAKNTQIIKYENEIQTLKRKFKTINTQN